MYRIFGLILLCLIATGCAQVKPDKPAPTSVAKSYGNRMRDSLPEGWSIGWHENTLWIRRVGLITVASTPPNAPAAETEPAATQPVATGSVTVMPFSSWTRQMAFVLTITFKEPLKPAEYQRRVESNAHREAVLEDYRVRLSGVAHKFDEYMPATPEEKKVVDQYRRAQKTLPHYDLPTLFAKDCSATITDSVAASMGDFSHIVNPEVAEDCQQTRHVVEGFFTKAPEAAAAHDK